MNATTYIGGIVRMIEQPKQITFTNNICFTELRVQFPERRKTGIVYLTFWGNLANDIVTYYQTNDYILIEGYLSFRNQKNSSRSNKIEITVLKLYPFQSSFGSLLSS